MNKYEKETLIKISVIPASLLVAFPIIYGLALLGEPQSLWLMQIIGAM